MSIEIERYTQKKTKNRRERTNKEYTYDRQSDATSRKDYTDVLAHNKEKAIASQQNRFAC